MRKYATTTTNEKGMAVTIEELREIRLKPHTQYELYIAEAEQETCKWKMEDELYVTGCGHKDMDPDCLTRWSGCPYCIRPIEIVPSEPAYPRFFRHRECTGVHWRVEICGTVVEVNKDHGSGVSRISEDILEQDEHFREISEQEAIELTSNNSEVTKNEPAVPEGYREPEEWEKECAEPPSGCIFYNEDDKKWQFNPCCKQWPIEDKVAVPKSWSPLPKCRDCGEPTRLEHWEGLVFVRCDMRKYDTRGRMCITNSEAVKAYPKGE